MFISKEDYGQLQNVLLILQSIIRNVVMSELEEAHEKESQKLFNRLNRNENVGILKFSNKELNKMPKEIKNALNKKGGDHIRQKENGVYEIRLNYQGKLYYGSSKNLAEAKKKFFYSVLENSNAESIKHGKTSDKSITVKDYALHYLEVFKKPNIVEESYRNYLSKVKNYIAPYFENVLMSDITGTACQQLLNDVLASGKGRTTEDLNNLLNWICSAAVADGILKNNPMQGVKVEQHEREPGKQIPVQIMADYLSRPLTNRSDFLIWLIAFSGVRPCEIKTIVFDDEGFITIKNAKRRKKKKPTYRRIPLHSALKPYTEQIKANLNMNTDVLSQAFKRRFPKEYHLYDLRHTFTSRVQECGANKQWVDYTTNHVGAQNTTDRVYTHWSDEFQSAEMEKLSYWSQI